MGLDDDVYADTEHACGCCGDDNIELRFSSTYLYTYTYQAAPGSFVCTTAFILRAKSIFLLTDHIISNIGVQYPVRVTWQVGI